MDGTRGRELARFLRARRARVTPGDVGIAPGVRRRTPGLRREEVALMSGVSVTWYTWLEQGRAANPSAEVLRAVARTLRLDAAETGYLLRLAGHLPGVAAWPVPAAGELVALAHMQDPAPAYVLDARWDLLAWNRAADALYGFSAVPEHERNLAWLTFALRPARERTVDWFGHAERIMAELRDDFGSRPELGDLMERLRAAFPEARRLLDEQAVRRGGGIAKDVKHPSAGGLRFHQSALVPAGAPGLRLVVLRPLDDTRDRLRWLMADR